MLYIYIHMYIYSIPQLILQDECPSCSMRPITVSFSSEATLQELYDHLKEDQRL